jgi:CRISPR/Cas system-associated protein Cas7 (RAMP superfamily)
MAKGTRKMKRIAGRRAGWTQGAGSTSHRTNSSVRVRISADGRTYISLRGEAADHWYQEYLRRLDEGSESQ